MERDYSVEISFGEASLSECILAAVQQTIDEE